MEANGVRLHVAEMGAGPLVLLLHGFPETWYAWRHVMPRLAAAGFRAAAPDLRGYGQSSRPHGVASYRVDVLADDVAGLLRGLGEERAFVVGHDWGGMAAWHAADAHADLIPRLVIVNAPHPRPFRRELKHADQAMRSAYAAFFQLPWLPEVALRAGNFALLARVFRTEPSRPGAYTEADVNEYRRAWSQPGALTAMLNYYRAVPLDHRRLGTTRQPTLVVWGDRDTHLLPRVLNGLEQWVPNVRVEHLPNASHWVPADEPERLSTLIAGFLHHE